MGLVKIAGLLALALLVSGCAAGGVQQGYAGGGYGGYGAYPGGGYGGYPGGRYGGYPSGYGGYPSGYPSGRYGGGYGGYPGGGYGGYGQRPFQGPSPGSYGRGQYDQGNRSPPPQGGQGNRPSPPQGGRPPLIGSDGRINPGGYR